MTAKARLLLLAALFVLGTTPASAQSVERLWSSANESYFRGDFARAAEQYQRLIDAGVRDPAVYFNLGITDARAGQLGRAVLDFERELWLAPGDDAAEQELLAARSALGRRRAEREGQALVRARPPLIEALVRPLSADFLAGSVLTLDALFFGLLLAYRFVRRESWRVGLAIGLPLIGLLLLGTAGGLLVKSEALKQGRAAIVLRDGAELREGPDGHAQVRSSAHEGESGRVLRGEGAFVQVELEAGDHGWISRKDIGAIRPD